MKKDRYDTDHFAYLTALFSMLFGFVFLGIALYILPFLFWDWSYAMPEFLANIIVSIRETSPESERAVEWLVFLIFMVPAVIFLAVAVVFNKKIEREILPHNNEEVVEIDEKQVEEDKSWSNKFYLVIFSVLILIYAFNKLFSI